MQQEIWSQGKKQSIEIESDTKVSSKDFKVVLVNMLKEIKLCLNNFKGKYELPECKGERERGR